MSLANEYLRSVTLKIKTLIENNEKLLSYNSYLNIENYLESHRFYIQEEKHKTPKILNNNFTQFINNFYTIKDDTLQKYFNKETTNSFVNLEDEFYFSEPLGEIDENQEENIKKNPKKIQLINNYMGKAIKDSNEEYCEIIIDFISTRLYDILISHKPDPEDKILFNGLIKDNLNYELGTGKTEIEPKIFTNILMSMKKVEKLRGIHQKRLSLMEVLTKFANYSTFKKGKAELNAADDTLAFMKYIISKVYLKSIILQCKFVCIFPGGYKNITTLTTAIMSVLFDILGIPEKPNKKETK